MPVLGEVADDLGRVVEDGSPGQAHHAQREPGAELEPEEDPGHDGEQGEHARPAEKAAPRNEKFFRERKAMKVNAANPVRVTVAALVMAPGA